MVGICSAFFGIGVSGAYDAVFVVSSSADYVDDDRDSLFYESNADPTIFLNAMLAVIGGKAELLWQIEDFCSLLEGEVMAGLVGRILCWIPSDLHCPNSTHIA